MADLEELRSIEGALERNEGNLSLASRELELHRISSILCTGPWASISPLPTASMRFKNS